MSFKNLVLEATAEDAERYSDWLMDLGALSVSVEDRDAGTEREQPIFAEPGEDAKGWWASNQVVALLPEEIAPEVFVAEITARQNGVEPRYRVDEIEEQDWVKLTQSQFDPIRVSERLWITPTWHEPPADNAVNIVLDPGLAFGTGSHPTTWMCLQWLDQVIKGGETVLDYGCGSGILAIAALKLGAASAVGVDIDTQAMTASRANAEQNGVEAHFCLPDANPDAQYDVVLANILANPLRLLAPLLAHHTRAGGRLVLAGLLQEQAEELIAIYSTWFDMENDHSREGWARLSGIRNNIAA